ncbi:hypothetical protein [Rhizosaccharibacter radicis]|uniref:Uncharacterized protein n=1 Tax=Rhizosaccharibacter radicis TaxID=2782605 RepID=A0ABT1VW83_9PROT|nr:hypothetical protein [Acetobacteraceae bacterium KSS12]
MFRKKSSAVPPAASPGKVPAGKAPAGRPASKISAGNANRPAAAPGSAGKQAYEARRAAKAGLSVEKWMAEKERRADTVREEAERERQRALKKAAKPGLLRRLLDRAHRPI